MAAEGRAVVLLDEAHLLHGWAAHLKGIWDRFRRKKTPVHIVATGSSALHLAAGSRESLAGRFERITLTHWSAASIAQVFGVAARGGRRPRRAHGLVPGRLPACARTCRAGRPTCATPSSSRPSAATSSPSRRCASPALLRQVFGVAASSPAQIVSLQKIQGQLQDAGALETIAHYLALLEEAFLVAPLAEVLERERRGAGRRRPSS